MKAALRLSRIAGVVLLPLATTAAPAQTVCDSGQIQILAPGSIFGRAIPVTWRVDPACDPIETAVSVHGADGHFISSGTPVYGGRELYSEQLAVSETGAYWLTAYAIDEQGSIAQSSPQAVLVVIPSFPTADPSAFTTTSDLTGTDDGNTLEHATKGTTLTAPSTYTGTDTDFLQPVGNVHVAALKSEHKVNQGHSDSSRGGTWVVVTNVGGVWAASTTRSEVAGQLDTPLTVGGESFVWDAAGVQAALDEDLRFFQSRGYPRPGLYGAACSGSTSTLFIDGSPFQSLGKSQLCGAASAGVTMAFREAASQSPYDTGSESTRSSLAYFIPAAPPGTKLQTATLRMFVQGTGAFVQTSDFSVFRLNGKVPSATVPLFCGTFDCSLLATWDFTTEAGALVSQGGGILPLTLDSIPPFVLQFPSQTISTAYWTFNPAVNYPWSQGGPANALTLTFQQTCPHDLTLAVTPSTVRPTFPPGTSLPGELASMPTAAAIEATARACPPGSGSPGSVTVQFAIDANLPQAGTADAGGHSHGTRPARAQGTLDASSCLAILDTQGVGRCAITYRPSEVSGVETLVGSAPSFADARAKVKVQVPGLTNLADVFTNFFRLTGARAAHPDNHWGTMDTTTNIQLVAFDFFAVFGATLGMNDLSLRTGGLFDIDGGWLPPHASHRKGTSVDIDPAACIDPNLEGGCSRGTVRVPKDFIAQQCADHGKGFLVREPPIHCEFPQ